MELFYTNANTNTHAMATEQAVKLLQEKFPYLAVEYGVSRIGLFVSYAKGQANETRDVDIFLEFERPIGFRFVELVGYLEDLLDDILEALQRIKAYVDGGVRSILVISDGLRYLRTHGQIIREAQESRLFR
ncbi:MAG: nucleotidyltransferase family protein [Methylococcales bacterium]